MTKRKIAITGVGGGVGQSIIKSLYDTEYELVGLDGEVLAPGLYSVPKSFIIPYANSDNYIKFLSEICKAEGISILFPGLDAELMPLSLSRHIFEEVGTKVIISEPSVIEISDDKLLTYQRLTALGFKVPETINLDSQTPAPVSFPVIIKQRVGGARSKNVFLIRDINHYNQLLSEFDLTNSNYVVQEHIEGEEYTCGSVSLNGKCQGVIVMKRILRNGDTYRCFSIRDEKIEATVRELIDAIKPFGACNIQLRIRNGIPYIFEINARCSGTTAARTLCGFNEPKMIAHYILEGINPSYVIKEQTVLRYWNELVVPNDRITNIKRTQANSNSDYIHL